MRLERDKTKRELQRIMKRDTSLKTIKDKALFVLEDLACNSDRLESELVYKYAHAGRGVCGNTHSDWKEDLERLYRNIIDTPHP